MIAMAREGKIDIILPPTAKLAPIVPSMALLDIPFFFPDETRFYKVLDGRVGKQLFEDLAQKDLIGLGYWNSGAKQITSNFPIRHTSDFMGKKMRVMRSPLIIQQFELLGAKPIVIDYYETKKALEDKQVDGQENPLESILRMKFHEVQKYLTLTSHAYLVEALIISTKTYQSLPPSQQAIVSAKSQTMIAKIRLNVVAQEALALAELKKSSIQIEEASPELKEELRLLLPDLVFNIEDEVGRNLIKMTSEDLGATSAHSDLVVIGLDADMSGPAALSGQAIERGIRLAIQDINDNGGVGNRKLRLLVKDHQSTVARSLTNIESFGSRGDVKAIFGGLQSGIIFGNRAAIAKTGLPFMVSWATATDLTKNDLMPNPFFRLSARDDAVGPYLAHQALKRSKKVALIFENSVWGHGNEKSITDELLRLKIKPVLSHSVNTGTKDFNGLTNDIEASGAGVVLMILNPSEAKEFILAFAGRQRHIPIVSHWGVTGGTLGRDLARELQSLDLKFFQTPGFIGNNRKEAKRLAEKYMVLYSVQSPLDINAPAGVIRSYDMMMLLGQALQLVQKNNALSLREALEQIDSYEGVAKTYNKPFANEGHEGLDSKSYTLGKFDQFGRIVPSDR